MLKLVYNNWKRKYNYIALILVILALLNFRIIIKNEMINTRIFSILITNLSWFFLSALLLLILRIYSFYQILFIKKNNLQKNEAFSGYKFIGLKILSGLIEVFLITVLVMAVIAINLHLISSNFLEESLNVLKLSGINPNREMPLIFATLLFSYSLLLETIYLSMVMVKTLFTDLKYKKTLSFIFFNSISFINLIVIIGIFKNLAYYNFITIVNIIVKTLLLILLWFMLTSFLLEENNFSQ